MTESNAPRTYRTGINRTGTIHMSSAGSNGADCNNTISTYARTMVLTRIAFRTLEQVTAAGRPCRRCFANMTEWN